MIDEDEKNRTNVIIEALGDGIILQDIDFKIVYQNQIQNEIYGNRVGEYCYKAYENKDTICEDCPIEASFSDGKIHKVERSVRTDKGILHIELTGSPLRDPAGKIIGGVKVVRDITGLKKVEETLRESEEKYRALFEATPVGIGIADLKGNILDANKSMQEMTGFTLEELKSIRVESTYVDPDERKSLLKTMQETGRVRDWEVRLKRKDGTIYYVLLNADLLELKGHKVLLTTARDITERKRAEREKDRFLKAFASSTDGITIADEKDRFIYVNEAYARIFGYSQEELIGNTWHKVIPAEMIAPTEKGISNTMHNMEVGTFYGEVPGLRKDGLIIPTEVRGKGIWDKDGYYQGHICIVRDITERKRSEEAMKKYARELEEANKLKDLFTDIIRHDLLNPVTVIKVLSEVLSENESLPEKKKNLEAIIKNVEKLEEMIQSAATLAKVEAVDKLDFDERNLCEILRKVISDFTPMFRNKGMRVEFLGEKKCMAEVNPHIEEIFSNLLSNAVKYSPENTRVTVGIKADDKDWVVFVKDQGKRIPDEYKEIIFERFKRIEKRGVKGTGLGLSIVKRIIDIHKGRVWIEDNPDGGNIFSVAIPAKRSE